MPTLFSWRLAFHASTAVALAMAVTGLCAARFEDHEVENLATFARLYGYVRFFHPSDEAANLDWDAFAVLGAETVSAVRGQEAMQQALRELFSPIAPRLRVMGGSDDGTTTDAAGQVASDRFIRWQHRGVELGPENPRYRSQRVLRFDGNRSQRGLFADPPDRPKGIEKQIGQGLRITMPLELPLSSGGRTMPATEEITQLQARLKALNLAGRVAGNDWAMRAAGVSVTWNVFQHFHPYLSDLGLKWDDMLYEGLRRARAANSRDDYYTALAWLVAQLQDGHGYVYGRDAAAGGLPIRVTPVGSELVIAATRGDTVLQRGDILVELDGVRAMDCLFEREQFVSGSPHLRRYRALNQFGDGALGSTAKLVVRRDGELLQFDVPRAREERGFFYNTISPFEFPEFAEVRPGIFYINLFTADRMVFAEKLRQLVHAKGIIFDQRWDGRLPKGGAAAAQGARLRLELDVIPHIIDEPTKGSPMRIPQITEPDRIRWTWMESTTTIDPKAPRLSARVVFINEPSVVSYGEFCLAFIAGHRSVTFVGEPTAGCNGGANFIPLPGGFRVMWTGTDVLKSDRSRLYTIGFAPDVPVASTLGAVREGRDEFLANAIAVIEGK